MGVSTLQHAMGGSILGMNDRGIYTAVAKSDGGYDVFHVLPDGYHVEISSFQDAGAALGQDFSGMITDRPTQELGDYTSGGSYSGGTSGGSTGGGYTADQIKQLNTQHQQNIRQIEQAYQNGLLDYNQKMAQQEDMRNNLRNQYMSGMESNNAYFSGISPDAFQSQMGNYNQKVLDAYNQGKTTIENNQKAIDFAKATNDQNYQAQLAGENTFDTNTGQYSGDYSFTAPVVQAPSINAVTVNPFTHAAKLNPYSPNAQTGGMSTQKAQQVDPILKALYPNA